MPQYMFHGGCHGCTNDISVCPGCMYMEPNWNLPNLNPRSIAQEKEKQKMIDLANEKAKLLEISNALSEMSF